jgi:hypothetical protein
MTTGNVLYIAGPITGIADYHIRFGDATRAATLQGWQPINPAALPAGMTEAAYMDICCAFVAVLMLPGWQESVGAHIEHDLAFKCGKRVMYELEPMV